VKSTNYDAFFPKVEQMEIEKNNFESSQTEDINMRQSVGKNVLIRDGVPLATMTFTELPTEWNKMKGSTDMFSSSLYDVIEPSIQIPKNNNKKEIEEDEYHEEDDENDEDEDDDDEDDDDDEQEELFEKPQFIRPPAAAIVPVAVPAAEVSPTPPIAPQVAPPIAPQVAPQAVATNIPVIQPTAVPTGRPLNMMDQLKATLAKREENKPAFVEPVRQAAPGSVPGRPLSMMDQLKATLAKREENKQAFVEPVRQAAPRPVPGRPLDLMGELKAKLASRSNTPEPQREVVPGIVNLTN
jgi:hypothetical protein